MDAAVIETLMEDVYLLANGRVSVLDMIVPLVRVEKLKPATDDDPLEVYHLHISDKLGFPFYDRTTLARTIVLLFYAMSYVIGEFE